MRPSLSTTTECRHPQATLTTWLPSSSVILIGSHLHYHSPYLSSNHLLRCSPGRVNACVFSTQAACGIACVVDSEFCKQHAAQADLQHMHMKHQGDDWDAMILGPGRLTGLHNAHRPDCHTAPSQMQRPARFRSRLQCALRRMLCLSLGDPACSSIPAKYQSWSTKAAGMRGEGAAGASSSGRLASPVQACTAAMHQVLHTSIVSSKQVACLKSRHKGRGECIFV